MTLNWHTLLHSFARPEVLWLLAFLPILLLAAIGARRRRRRVLARLGHLPALAALTEKRRQWRVIRGTCLVLGLICLVVGIAGPQWGREPEGTTAEGRDLVVVLDVSRSMLADDLAPSRQERAKEAIKDMVENAVKKRGGHRLALVAFAASAKILCPLTHDYDHFLAKVDEIDAAFLPRDLRPGPNSISGTRIGEGLRMAVQEVHANSNYRGFQDVLMISDGDDPVRDNEWRVGAEAAKEAGVSLYVVGVGDADKGGRIPVGKDEYLKHENAEVVSKLQRRPLEEIAKRAKGHYVEAGINAPPLRDLFLGKIEPGDKREVADDALKLYRQRYSWFYGAALSLLAAELTFGAPLGLGWLFRRKPKEAVKRPIIADRMVVERT